MISTLSLNIIPDTYNNNSQLPGGPFFIRILLASVLMYLVVSFIQVMLKLMLDHRIKKRIIEKGIPEETARAILHSGNNGLKETALKWFLVFTGIAFGLFIIALTRTEGIYSLAILSCCMALSFGIYYFFNRNKNL